MKKKLKNIKSLLILIGVIILVNYISATNFFRVDLTEDQRYSLSPATKELLYQLEAPIQLEILLDGEELGPEFTLLKKSIIDKLDEFSRYTDQAITYGAFNPNTIENDTAKYDYVQGLFRLGIKPKMMVDVENGTLSKRNILFPGALVAYNGKVEGINFFKFNEIPRNKRQRRELITKSIENIEYELSYTLRKLLTKEKKTVSFLTGHGELEVNQTRTIIKQLSELYNIRTINLHDSASLEGSDLVIMAKPQEEFNEKEKFILDQYIVNGGNALFLYDPVGEIADSTTEQFSYIGARELNLRDLFFRMGVRVNNDLVKDVQCIQIDGANWYYFPFLFNFNTESPIVRNLDAVSARFVSTIDTTKAEGIKKTPLIFSSKVSRKVNVPVIINSALGSPIKEEQFQEGSFPVAYLLEGKFLSNYQFRPSPIKGQKVVEQKESARVIFIADGDIISDILDEKSGKQFPLGFDPYSGKQYGNSEFIKNCIEYLLEGNTLTAAKSKERLVRPLDTQKVKNDRLYWQVINLLVPIVLVSLFGVGKYLLRRRKYAIKSTSN